MHYANGQEAKAGDLVYNPSQGPFEDEIIGMLIGANANGTTCNGRVATLLIRGKSDCGISGWMPMALTGNCWCVTVSDLMPLDLPQVPLKPTT